MVTTANPLVPMSRRALIEARRPTLLPDRRDRTARDRLLRRIRAEFDEMPCLRLTSAQAARLFGVAEEACVRMLSTLVGDRILVRGPDGRYGRCDW